MHPKQAKRKHVGPPISYFTPSDPGEFPTEQEFASLNDDMMIKMMDELVPSNSTPDTMNNIKPLEQHKIPFNSVEPAVVDQQSSQQDDEDLFSFDVFSSMPPPPPPPGTPTTTRRLDRKPAALETINMDSLQYLRQRFRDIEENTDIASNIIEPWRVPEFWNHESVVWLPGSDKENNRMAFRLFDSSWYSGYVCAVKRENESLHLPTYFHWPAKFTGAFINKVLIPVQLQVEAGDPTKYLGKNPFFIQDPPDFYAHQSHRSCKEIGAYLRPFLYEGSNRVLYRWFQYLPLPVRKCRDSNEKRFGSSAIITVEEMYRTTMVLLDMFTKYCEIEKTQVDPVDPRVRRSRTG
ncbi:unnamed protein product [Orchesella dallaii]|uniref:Uncharacterized protein n=1 Tax=Orchesella dallaii TaxID=48710 RepID=A0ABP1RIX1_9HEXA